MNPTSTNFLSSVFSRCEEKDQFVIIYLLWCKSGTRTWDPGPQVPGTWDPPQCLKVGTGTPLKFKSGTPGPPTKFKSGTPSPLFNEFIFFQNIYSFFFTYLFLFLF